jgi:hypothetical protein
MATQTVERYIATQTIEQYLKNEKWPIAAKPEEQLEAGTASFLNRVKDMLWRMTFGISFSGFFLPLEPAFRHSKVLSLKEKTELEAPLMGL